MLQANLRMNLEGWIGLLEDCDLLRSGDSTVGPEQFGIKQATCCFLWSQDFVSDELSRPEATQHLSFVGFIEAICRVPMFMQLIHENELALYSLNSMDEAEKKVRQVHS